MRLKWHSSGVHPRAFVWFRLRNSFHPSLPSFNAMLMYAVVMASGGPVESVTFTRGILVALTTGNPQPVDGPPDHPRADHGPGWRSSPEQTASRAMSSRMVQDGADGAYCLCRFGQFGGGEGSWRLKIAPIKTWQGCRWQILSPLQVSAGCRFLAFFTGFESLLFFCMLRQFLDLLNSIACYRGAIMLSL